MQLRHRIKIEPVRQRAAQEPGRPPERLHRFAGVLAPREMREMHVRMRKIRRHVDMSHRDRPNARILDLVAQQVGKLLLDLVADTYWALRAFLHGLHFTMRRRDTEEIFLAVLGASASLCELFRPYNVRETSTISYTSSWSPFSMSL